MSGKILFSDLFDECINFIDDCDELNCFTRAKSLQENKILECQEQVRKIKSYKQQVAYKETEHLANELFHLQCLTNALKSCLEMWVELKNENYSNAWTKLIDSVEYTETAKKIKTYEGIESLTGKLKNIEESIFPKWALYNSPGFIETIGQCSICNKNFLECEHIENEIYIGALCQRVNREIKHVDHSALVYDPRDRRCIITKKSNEEGRMIDYFTLEEDQEAESSTKDGEMRLECIVLTTHDMDFN